MDLKVLVQQSTSPYEPTALQAESLDLSGDRPAARAYLLDCIDDLTKDESASRDALLAAGLEDVPRGPAIAPPPGTEGDTSPGEGEEIDQDAVAAKEEVREGICMGIGIRVQQQQGFLKLLFVILLGYLSFLHPQTSIEKVFFPVERDLGLPTPL